jgi:predicted DNA-binding transcriptional regulator AlpA
MTKPAFYRVAQLVTTPSKTGLLPFSNPTLWRLVKKGQFPKPVQLAPNVTAWPAEAVHAWIEAKKGGTMN